MECRCEGPQGQGCGRDNQGRHVGQRPREGVRAALLDDPHLALEIWGQWKTEIENLARTFEGVKARLAANSAQHAEKRQQQQAFTFAASSRDENASIIIKNPMLPLNPKYVKLDQRLKLARAFEPVSMDEFEPLDRAARYHYYHNLSVSMRVALLNFAVGENIGIHTDCQERGEIAADARVPTLRYFEFQFWPANEHVKAALMYSGRFPLRLAMQKRTLRKHHAHAHYCAQQFVLYKTWMHKFRSVAMPMSVSVARALSLHENGVGRECDRYGTLTLISTHYNPKACDG